MTRITITTEQRKERNPSTRKYRLRYVGHDTNRNPVFMGKSEDVLRLQSAIGSENLPPQNVGFAENESAEPRVRITITTEQRKEHNPSTHKYRLRYIWHDANNNPVFEGKEEDIQRLRSAIGSENLPPQGVPAKDDEPNPGTPPTSTASAADKPATAAENLERALEGTPGHDR